MIALLAAVLLQADPLQESLVELFKSLSEEQRGRCLKEADDAERDAEVFTGGARPGLAIRDLSEEQRGKLVGAMKRFLSESGFEQAMKVAEQSHPKAGLQAYYLNFFGDPTRAKEWAVRVSEHHITLVHAASDPLRFGPVLLGANPPELWRSQEDAGIACFAALSEADRAKVVRRGTAASGEALGDRGALIGDLSEAAARAASALVEERLKLFGEDQRRKLRAIIEAGGGVARLRIAFFGEMTRRCADGGRADFKIGSGTFLLDYESSRGHIHLTVRGRAGK